MADMSKEIELYGSEALRRKAVRVGKIDGNIRALAEAMIEVMHANNGLGVAAEQIGRSEAVCVVHVPLQHDAAGGEPHEEYASAAPGLLVLVNPEITESNGEQVDKEGCLSFPEIYVSIKRAARIKARYLSLDGREKTVEAEGLLARAIQHEVDHLHGMLLVDRMSPVQKVSMAGKLKRLRKKGRG